MRGLEKVEFQALMTASALNLKKLVLERSHSLARRLSATDYFFDTLVKHSLLSAKR
jgi:site-specific recombinase XerC